MKLRNRVVTEGRITLVCEKGGILLPESGETLEEVSVGAIKPGSSEAERAGSRLLCGQPSSAFKKTHCVT